MVNTNKKALISYPPLKLMYITNYPDVANIGEDKIYFID